MASKGNLIVNIEFEAGKVHGARLLVPVLGIDEHLRHQTVIRDLQAGNYQGTLITYFIPDGELKQQIRITIAPGKDNAYNYNLINPPKEVLIRPVDSKDRTLVSSEIKIEGMDQNFRPVRDEKGVPCRLRPGKYQIKIVLPDFKVKTIPIEITDDVSVYMLAVEPRENIRKASRVQMSVPVAYQTKEGKWFSTKTINLSSTGICLVKEPNEVKGDQVFLRLLVPIREEPLECYAKVCWVKDNSQTLPQMGLELEVDEQIRTSLDEWLKLTDKSREKDHNFLRKQY